jgi:hypothetical protein
MMTVVSALPLSLPTLSGELKSISTADPQHTAQDLPVDGIVIFPLPVGTAWHSAVLHPERYAWGTEEPILAESSWSTATIAYLPKPDWPCKCPKMPEYSKSPVWKLDPSQLKSFLLWETFLDSLTPKRNLSPSRSDNCSTEIELNTY